MKEVLEFILKNITTLPDDIKIEEKEEDGGTNYLITVNPADVGRIIGKEGKVIKAIRTIMRVIAIQKGVRVRVSVLSEDNHEPTSAQPQEDLVTEVVDEVAETEPVTENDLTEEVVVTPEEGPKEEVVPPSDELTVEV
ncbi:MAG: KH domain-containing protein [bacterium]